VLGKLRVGKKSRKEVVGKNKLMRRLRMESLEDRCMLSTVTTNIDVNDDHDGLTTLREAIESTLAGGTVDFAQSLDGAKIDLDPILGEIAFSKSLTIDATMLANGLTIDAGGNSRIFHVANSSLTGTISLAGMTLTGGNAPFYGGAIFMESGSGSSYEATKLVLDSMTITGNEADFGGGIAVRDTNAFTLDVRNSTITGNSAISGGGGISSRAQYVLLTNSTVSDNEASYGGGLELRAFSYGPASIEIQQSIITNNTVGSGDRGGAGMYVRQIGGEVTISNTVISGNRAIGNEANFGGLRIKMYSGVLKIDRSTISETEPMMMPVGFIWT